MFGLCRVSRGTCFLVLFFLGWMIAESTGEITRSSLGKEIHTSCLDVHQFGEKIAQPDQVGRIHAAYKEAYHMLAFANKTMMDVWKLRASYWDKTRVETTYAALQGESNKGILRKQDHFRWAGGEFSKYFPAPFASHLSYSSSHQRYMLITV